MLDKLDLTDLFSCHLLRVISTFGKVVEEYSDFMIFVALTIILTDVYKIE